MDNFGLESSSGDSDEDDYCKIDYSLLQSTLDNTNDEKTIAQRQLLKAAKTQKSKLSKKKLLAKAGGKGSGKFPSTYFLLWLLNVDHIFSYQKYYQKPS